LVNSLAVSEIVSQQDSVEQVVRKLLSWCGSTAILSATYVPWGNPLLFRRLRRQQRLVNLIPDVSQDFDYFLSQRVLSGELCFGGE
jgi:hypothetical protein